MIESELKAESFYADALAFFPPAPLPGSRCLKMPDLPLSGHSALENHLSRFLKDLYGGSLDLVISTGSVFRHPVPGKHALEENMLRLSPGDEISFSLLGQKLQERGYQRSEIVEYCGEFTFRGGIVDVYPYGHTYPLRIEFFGNTVDSIRLFNPNDQNTFALSDSGKIPPASFFFLREETDTGCAPGKHTGNTACGFEKRRLFAGIYPRNTL
ncbi:MAG: hypothetical protein U5N26_01380 [Candidatus Marinimicrobia bacterium]|nr:hypothetical protein [Candidatus Neomarinimicrobiota bacterium]